MKLRWKVFGIVVTALAGIGAASLGLAIADREPPLLFDRAEALSDSVPQGGTIQLEFAVFRRRICDSDAMRTLTDSAHVEHAIPSFTKGPRRLAGYDRYRRSITIPDAAATGLATYRVHVKYYCNPMHRLGWPIEVVSPPIRFRITPRPVLLLPPPKVQPDDDG
jgi:hypothetical protein